MKDVVARAVPQPIREARVLPDITMTGGRSGFISDDPTILRI